MQPASFDNNKKRPIDSDLEFQSPKQMQQASFGNNKKTPFWFKSGISAAKTSTHGTLLRAILSYGSLECQNAIVAGPILATGCKKCSADVSAFPNDDGSRSNAFMWHSLTLPPMCVYVCARACVRVYMCVRALVCVCAWVRVCVSAWV